MSKYIDETYILNFLTLAELNAKLSGATDRTLAIAALIEAAESEVDMRIVVRYDSISEVPNALKRITLALFLYFLSSRQGTMEERIEKDYNRAIENLKMLRNGELTLADSDGEKITEFKTIPIGINIDKYDGKLREKYNKYRYET